MSSSPQPSSRLARLLTLPLLFALCAALFSGNAERLHARLLWLGESLFTGYFQLQADPKMPPNCDELFEENKGGVGADEDEDLEALFGDEVPAPKSAAQSDEDELEGLFGEEEGESESDRKSALLEAQKRAKEQCEQEHRDAKRAEGAEAKGEGEGRAVRLPLDAGDVVGVQRDVQ